MTPDTTILEDVNILINNLNDCVDVGYDLPRASCRPALATASRALEAIHLLMQIERLAVEDRVFIFEQRPGEFYAYRSAYRISGRAYLHDNGKWRPTMCQNMYFGTRKEAANFAYVTLFGQEDPLSLSLTK